MENSIELTTNDTMALNRFILIKFFSIIPRKVLPKHLYVGFGELDFLFHWRNWFTRIILYFHSILILFESLRLLLFDIRNIHFRYCEVWRVLLGIQQSLIWTHNRWFYQSIWRFWVAIWLILNDFNLRKVDNILFATFKVNWQCFVCYWIVVDLAKLENYNLWFFISRNLCRDRATFFFSIF